jgi:hypothetical protein
MFRKTNNTYYLGGENSMNGKNNFVKKKIDRIEASNIRRVEPDWS